MISPDTDDGGGATGRFTVNVEDNPAVVERIVYHEKGGPFTDCYDPDPKYQTAAPA